jgi:hypothetical protein
VTDSERGAFLLRFLLDMGSTEIIANSDGTVTLPATACVRLANIITNSAYL